MIGVIADDLTGAAEIGAIGWRYGLRAEVILNRQVGGEANLVCVDTDSRSCAPAEAARRAEAAARLLACAGARWIYKKVDSVLRGEVTREVEAAARKLGFGLALVVPANPSFGRVIRDGCYYIRDRPIHETEFAFDPEHPRLSCDVRDLVKPAKTLPIHVCRSRDTLPSSGIVIGEAETAMDLRRWAGKRSPELLPAGGAEFFAALLTAAGYKAGAVRTDGPPDGAGTRKLFVCGTKSEASADFIRAARAAGTVVYSLPAALAEGAPFAPATCQALGRAAADALTARGRVILSIGLPPVQQPVVAKQLAVHLVELAQTVLRLAEPQEVYAEGGATARELVRGMGWGRLTVTREWAPGLVTLGAPAPKLLKLTIKPGSYPWPPAWTS